MYYVYAHWLLNEGTLQKGGSMEPTEPPLDPPLGMLPWELALLTT